ncbi:uncharacterized protein FIESC28_09674 [Fusarium coffeatum]|uniref:chitinase n=1 Tax=Fusarium coffeatum TaxID=231269 RepID=A0A366R0C8_9HYPO|nr:uncharacterized protein FIESC28_09674 [Fusarium coffeatum]RBR09928.1 hypothetical protein FIESC28_09674 [Fusarium coffeatum]
MYFALLVSLGAALVADAAESRNVLYYDQWHTTNTPPTSKTKAVTHVMMSFANSSVFAGLPVPEYKPFKPLNEVRELFDHKVNICLAVGGWGDNIGFDASIQTDLSIANFAKNLSITLDRFGFDCVDIDWEYPGGNGENYKQTKENENANQVEQFPTLLQEIKHSIGAKELSIAVPGLERDMIAYVPDVASKIAKAVDFINIMSYDLMNRRDSLTTHHTSVQGTVSAVDSYISLGFPASKLVVGIPFYAKWFTTKKGHTCSQPTGCPTELLENDDGSDTGKSGAITFEASNFAEPPAELMLSPDGTCGTGTSFKCAEGSCCAPSGWCGSTPEHCNIGCQVPYGRCDGVDVLKSFRKAVENGQTDDEKSAQWYWDAQTEIFWSWDTPDLIQKKIRLLAETRGIKSVMAWSLAQDSHDWSHLKAMQTVFVAVNA